MKNVQIQLSRFTGPLDLLLNLISKKKLHISEIALSEVTEQYLRYLDTIEERDADELADFLVVATRLLLLKSRTLLPKFAADEEDGQSLERQLRLYKAFMDASKPLSKLWLGSGRSLWHDEPPRRPTAFVPSENVTLATLRRSMIQLVNRLEPPKELPETRIDRAVSMKEKINRIRELLRAAKRLSFQDIVGEVRNKTEVIVSFLAILELMKQRAVALRQDESFGDIDIVRL